MIPARYATILFGFILSGLMSCIVSGIATARELQASCNAVRLFRAVQNQEVRRRGQAEARSIREHDDSWLGYNSSNTPERAAALLRRIQKEEARASRTELGQTEAGRWEPLD